MRRAKTKKSEERATAPAPVPGGPRVVPDPAAMRIRYVGAITTLVDVELRVAAARLLATYPSMTCQRFIELAEQAFDDVAGQVARSCSDARLEASPAVAGGGGEVAELRSRCESLERRLAQLDRDLSTAMSGHKISEK
jgi:hypothetical protein